MKLPVLLWGIRGLSRAARQSARDSKSTDRAGAITDRSFIESSSDFWEDTTTERQKGTIPPPSIRVLYIIHERASLGKEKMENCIKKRGKIFDNRQKSQKPYAQIPVLPVQGGKKLKNL